MSEYLPMFPLNIVVYPGEKLNLHIFEPRYKQLVLDCETTNKNFGIPTYIKNAVGHYGTETELLSIEKKYDNGEMDIRCKGLRIFKLLKFDKKAPDRLYAGGEIEYIENKDDGDIVTQVRIKELMQQLYETMGLKSLSKNLEESQLNSYTIAHQLGLSLEQEYALLQVNSEADRLEGLRLHLENILPIVQETERLKERVKLNGHFRSLLPPNF